VVDVDSNFHCNPCDDGKATATIAKEKKRAARERAKAEQDTLLAKLACYICLSNDDGDSPQVLQTGRAQARPFCVLFHRGQDGHDQDPA
jgi:hypothetical protein